MSLVTFFPDYSALPQLAHYFKKMQHDLKMATNSWQKQIVVYHMCYATYPEAAPPAVQPLHVIVPNCQLPQLHPLV